METVKEPAGIDPAVKAAIQEACDRAASGIPPTRDEKLEAIAAMNRMREQIRQRIGIQNVAVDLVRQSRDGK
jgi:hypothetical protein